MTERIALHTRLKAGRELEYERIHARISDALDTSLRAAGVTGWTIWRSGRDLFHLVEVDDFAAMNATLNDDPVNLDWQAEITQLLEPADDTSVEHGLRQVWTLPEVAP